MINFNFQGYALGCLYYNNTIHYNTASNINHDVAAATIPAFSALISGVHLDI